MSRILSSLAGALLQILHVYDPVEYSIATGEDFFDGEQLAADFGTLRVELTVVPVPAAAWLMLSGLPC